MCARRKVQFNSLTGSDIRIARRSPANPSQLQPIYNLLGQQTSQGIANVGVDKNALAILQANLIPLPNSPTGCDFAVANLDPRIRTTATMLWFRHQLIGAKSYSALTIR